MTQEEIVDAGIDYTMRTCPVCIGGAKFEEKIRQYNRNASFEAGAKWAKEQITKEITQWLSEELFEDKVTSNPYYNSNVKSKRYDTVNEFIEALKKAIDDQI
jgi:hypothetical protein